MNKEQIHCIRDIAIAYENTDPLNAYRLIRVARKWEPGGPPIARVYWKLRKKVFWNALMAIDFTVIVELIGDSWKSLESRFSSGLPMPETRQDDDFRVMGTLSGKIQHSDPVGAYQLCRILARKNPGDKNAIAREEELRRKISGTMYTSRSDGTTERLNAIIIGYLIAQKMNIPYKFSWATDVAGVFNELLSVENAIPAFFDPAFVERYHMDFQITQRYKISDIAVPSCEFVSSMRLEEPLSDDDIPPAIATHLNFSPAVVIDKKFLRQWDRERLDAIDLIFATPYRECLSRFRSELGSFLAIHYRGGDVIYGIYRHTKIAVRGKTEPLPVIKHVIQKYSERKILVFGTPVGDTLNDLKYLENKYDNMQLSMRLANADMDHVLQDSMMMSGCQSLITSPGTGVARLAGIFNPELERISFRELVSDHEYFQLCLDNIENPVYNPIQRSYINVRALALCDTLHVSIEIREMLLSNIEALDPDNKLLWYQQDY